MCEPTTLAIASLVMTGAGVATQAQAAANASQAQKNAYEYQAAVSRNNQKIAEWQAQNAIAQGQEAEIDQRRKMAALKGSQRAGLAAKGLDISSGSALNILTDTDYLGEMDVLNIRSNAERQAWAQRVQGSNEAANATLLSMRADAENPLMAGAGTLLTGAGSVADRWYTYNRPTASTRTS
jgi:hypothetical protein